MSWQKMLQSIGDSAEYWGKSGCGVNFSDNVEFILICKLLYFKNSHTFSADILIFLHFFNSYSNPLCCKIIFCMFFFCNVIYATEEYLSFFDRYLNGYLSYFRFSEFFWGYWRLELRVNCRSHSVWENSREKKC